jgi:hypothetical protein
MNKNCFFITIIFVLLTHLHLSAQKVYEIEIGDTLDFAYFTMSHGNHVGNITLQYPRLKDSLPDGIYRVFDYPIGSKKKKQRYLYLEVTYINGVKDGQEFFYGYHFDKKMQPVMSSITLTEYKNGKLDGLFVMADVNAERTITIREIKTFKNDSANGINIIAPYGFIREVLYYSNNEVKDTIWAENKSLDNIYYMMINNPFYKEDYLFRLIKTNVIKSKLRKRED